jgi:hypothetical protein
MPCDRHGLSFDPMAHRYWKGPRELLAVTAVLRAAGLVDSTWYTAESRVRGTAVHRATHARDRGDGLATHDPMVAPYLDAYETFLHDARPIWQGLEEPIADLQLGYAGTPDRWGTLQGEPVVVDLKTGTVPSWTPLQLVAYARLALEDVRRPRRRLVVQLLPTGRYSVREYPLVNFGRDERVFLAALAVAQWKRAA